MTEWQPIESPPDVKCAVAFFHANEPLSWDCMPGDRYSTGDFMPCDLAGLEPCCNGSFDWDDDMTPPTHWMKLSEPPKDETNASPRPF